MSQPRPLFWLWSGQTVSNSFVLSAKQSSRTSNFNVFWSFVWRGRGSHHQPPTCQVKAQPLHYPVPPILINTIRNLVFEIIMCMLSFTLKHVQVDCKAYPTQMKSHCLIAILKLFNGSQCVWHPPSSTNPLWGCWYVHLEACRHPQVTNAGVGCSGEK